MKFKRGKKLKIEHNKKLLIAIMILVGLLVVLLTINKSGVKTEEKAEPTQIPNPAAVYCVENGGVVEMREGAYGVYGVCILRFSCQALDVISPETWMPLIYSSGTCLEHARYDSFPHF